MEDPFTHICPYTHMSTNIHPGKMDTCPLCVYHVYQLHCSLSNATHTSSLTAKNDLQTPEFILNSLGFFSPLKTDKSPLIAHFLPLNFLSICYTNQSRFQRKGCSPREPVQGRLSGYCPGVPADQLRAATASQA